MSHKVTSAVVKQHE